MSEFSSYVWTIIAVVATALGLVVGAFFIIWKQQNRRNPLARPSNQQKAPCFRGVSLEGVGKSELKFGCQPDILAARKQLLKSVDLEEEKRVQSEQLSEMFKLLQQMDPESDIKMSDIEVQAKLYVQ